MKSYVLQDEVGQIAEASLDLGRARLSRASGPSTPISSSIGRTRYEQAGDDEVLAAFRLLSETEGIIPALEPAHALAWLVREAGAVGADAAPPCSSRCRGGATRTSPRCGRCCGDDAREAATAAGSRTSSHLRARRDAGRKLLVPYVTGGMGPDWIEAVHAVADAGADAVEIGIPFSDPMIDGPTIQEARCGPCSGGRRRRRCSTRWPVPIWPCRCA